MALKTLNKLPKDESKLPNVFKKEFIDTRKIDPYYWEVWQRVETMFNLAKKGKLDRIPDKEVYQAREYVRELIRDLSKVLKKEEKEQKNE